MSQPEYDVAVIEDVMVPMRDDVRLAADIYRPARDGVVVRLGLAQENIEWGGVRIHDPA